MDKQTFYAELSERLLNLGLSQEYIERHLAQFDTYFGDKSDKEISSEIAKLGDLDKVAARIKRMTEKSINEAKLENEAQNQNAPEENNIINRDDNERADEFEDIRVTDDDVTVFVKPDESSDKGTDSDDPFAEESHGTKRGVAITETDEPSVAVATLDQETIENNRKKFWIIFGATLPITIALLAATAAAFALAFFAIAVIILIAIGALVFITAAGTIVSVFGLIFGVSQMLYSVPIGLYECGISVMIAAVAIFIGVLVYNFAVRLMPYAAKWLLVFVHYVVRKYRELYVYLKKECIGL